MTALRTLRAVLATLLVAAIIPLITGSSPAMAADGSGLRVVITEMTPTVLGDSGKVTLSGTLTNTGKKPWTQLQAYLLIRNTPLADRETLKAEAAKDQGFAGTRIVDPGRFDELGGLKPGASTTFKLTIPVKELPITGANGVYPIGVQILGTDSTGHRGNAAVARATTFLPHMNGVQQTAKSTVVWSLLMPSARGVDGVITDADDLLSAISPGGQLRNLLDLIGSTPPGSRGVIVDPALVVAVDELANGENAGRDLTEYEMGTAASFRDDLISIAAMPSASILDYDRTDVFALRSDAASRLRLMNAVERATDAVVDKYGLSRNRITWPTASGVSSLLLRTVRERGDVPVLVSAKALPDWDTADGVLQGYRTSAGDLPLLIDDDIAAGVPGKNTTATFRQQVAADAALAALSGGDRHESVVVIGPSFNPGIGSTWSEISAPYIDPQPMSLIVRGDRYSGGIAAPRSSPISSNQVAAADAAAQAADLLNTAAVDNPELEDDLAEQIAQVLGVRWRSDRAAGERAATWVASQISNNLASITVAAPPEVTLSSAEGGFPITITNDSTTTVSVGLRLDSSNPALNFPDQTPVQIAAGERRTVTVEIDLKEQNVTTVTVHLLTPDGRTFGLTDDFIIRSSRVGLMLWAAMGAAGLFVVFALVRRFGRRGAKKNPSPAGELDE